MALQRFSFLFQVTTEPTSRANANPHTGGWSEQVWCDDATTADGVGINALAALRAQVLPKQCTLVGWRVGQFTAVGNKLVPGGTATIKHFYPGNNLFTVDVPQACLNMSGSVAGGPNKSKVTLRGFPDEGVVNGELHLQTGLWIAIRGYYRRLIDSSWGTIVRDLGQGGRQVLSVASGVATLGDVAGLAVGDYLRFSHVRNASGSPISGSFRIGAITGAAVTLNGLNASFTAGFGGLARKDLIRFASFATFSSWRVGVKKVGAPFERYRGRR